MQYEPIHQKKAKETAYIDEELMGKKNRKAFKSAAYSFGLGIGFLVLSPLLPEMGTKEKSDALMSVFRVIAMWMIFYSAATGVAFIFFRKSVKMVLMLLNWFLVPSLAIWGFMEISGILSGS